MAVGRRFLARAAALGLAAVACTLSSAETPDGASEVLQAQGQGRGVAQPIVVHRLTRLQYNNIVRDLLHTTLTPADDFPADPAVGGYDNVATSLTLSPQLASLYYQAAQALADDATSDKPRWGLTVSGPAAGPTASPDGSPLSNWGWGIRSPFVVTVDVPLDDQAQLSVVAGGQATQAPTPLLQVALDGATVTTFTVSASTSVPATYTVSLPVTAGTHQLALTFTNKVTDNATTSSTDSELAIGQIRLESQTVTTSPGLAQLMVCDPNVAADPEGCWRQVATSFVTRAWRRPLTDDQSTRIGALWRSLVAQGDHTLALKSLIQATLVSPNFLYVFSRARPADGGAAAGLDDYDLASRLSLFLWSSMPDAELLAAAGKGALRDPLGLSGEVDRMLKDPKVQGLLDGFVGQWLDTRALDSAAPDPTVFPTWSPAIKNLMKAETQAFFADYLTNGQPIETMLAPDFGFLSDTLAAHYGLPAPGKSTLTRVPLAPTLRRGLLGQGAWLTANSVQTRTSPVKRGRFIMQNLLCQTVLPPPPGIAPLPSSMTGQQVTQRQLLDAHTQNPTCAGCHNVIDPPGFAAEIYDGIGRPRTLDGNLPIDATGTLFGAPFDGAMELAGIIAGDPNFVRCVGQQLYGYALCRTIGAADGPPLADIAAAAASEGGHLDVLIKKIVISPQFTGAPTS